MNREVDMSNHTIEVKVDTSPLKKALKSIAEKYATNYVHELAIDGIASEYGEIKKITTSSTNGIITGWSNIAWYPSRIESNTDENWASWYPKSNQDKNEYTDEELIVIESIDSLILDEVLPDYDSIEFVDELTETHWTFDEFDIEYDSQEEAMYVKIYSDSKEVENKPESIECTSCSRTINLYGLLGNEVYCDCGKLNSIVVHKKTEIKNAIKDRYGMWGRLIPASAFANVFDVNTVSRTSSVDGYTYSFVSSDEAIRHNHVEIDYDGEEE